MRSRFGQRNWHDTPAGRRDSEKTRDAIRVDNERRRLRELETTPIVVIVDDITDATDEVTT